MTKTTFENKCKILGDFWVAYDREDDEGRWKNFVDYATMSLPLAFMLSLEMIEPKGKHAYDLIDEAWGLFLDLLEVSDKGYTDLEELLPTGEDVL